MAKWMKSSKDDSVNEACQDRICQHMYHGLMLFITADRPENDAGTNEKNFKDLLKWVRIANFGYNEIKCRYVIKDEAAGEMKSVDNENSLCIYGSVDRGKELLTLGKRLGKRFNQDFLMFVDADNMAYLICIGENNADYGPVGTKEELGEFATDTFMQYYSGIGKKEFSFKSVSAATKRSPKFSDNYEADTLRQAMEKYDDWEYHFYHRPGLEDLSDNERKILENL